MSTQKMGHPTSMGGGLSNFRGYPTRWFRVGGGVHPRGGIHVSTILFVIWGPDRGRIKQMTLSFMKTTSVIKTRPQDNINPDIDTVHGDLRVTVTDEDGRNYSDDRNRMYRICKIFYSVFGTNLTVTSNGQLVCLSALPLRHDTFVTI